MSTEKDVLMGGLTKLFNKTEDELAELIYEKSEDSDELVIKEGALDSIIDLDTKRVAKIKESSVNQKDLQERFDQGFNKGFKEGKEELEAELRKSAGVESAAKGSELIQEVIKNISECNLPSEDQIKTHPVYLELEKNSVRKDEHQQVVAEFENFKLNQERNSKLQTIRKDAIVVRNKLNPVLSEIPEVAQTRQDDYLAKFDSYDYELDENGNHIISKDGKRLEDAHGNPLKFSDFAASIASKCYEFNKADDIDNSGNRNFPKNGNISVPKTEKEYLEKWAELKNAGRTEDATKLHLAWSASQS